MRSAHSLVRATLSAAVTATFSAVLVAAFCASVLTACSQKPVPTSLLSASERQAIEPTSTPQLAQAEAHRARALDDGLGVDAQRDHATLSRLYEAQAEAQAEITALTADLERRQEEAATWRAAYEQKDAERQVLAAAVDFTRAAQVAEREASREFEVAQTDEARRHRRRRDAYSSGLGEALSALEARLALVESARDTLELQTPEPSPADAPDANLTNSTDDPDVSARFVQLSAEVNEALAALEREREQLVFANQDACDALVSHIETADLPFGQHDEGLVIYGEDADGNASATRAIRRALSNSQLGEMVVVRGRSLARRLQHEGAVLRGEPELVLVVACAPGARRGTANLD